MMWLSWRQFRIQALFGAGALAVLAVYMVSLGADIRDAYDAYQAKCEGSANCAEARSQFRSAYQNTLLFLATGLALIPAVIGTFWGAPLVARELENGTHRLVWNQSVTRPRWLLSKILLVGLAAVIVTGAAAALLTWAARPFDEVVKEQFETFVFGARNIAPIGYAAVAFTFGTVVGLLLRKTLPAMAVTLVVFLAFQFFFPNVVRPSLMPPVKATLPMTVEAINGAQNLGSIGGGSVIGGVKIPNPPDAWIAETSPLRTADGKTLSASKFNDCLDSPPKTGAGGTFGDTAVCLAKHNLHVDVQYHPSSRYWSFQWLETAIYLTLSGVLTAFGLWRIRRRVS
ncbi:ABC transporter permease subunit [Streptomyces caelestis]|jgi:ABC-type transport system involved in multi-copper enzyme maturation permease subunit|uniref:ABC-type transport system involved in multi-copper enzyme maturation permease subunit n=2 Tax=Streptomyces caelestis TaxID=36816 RepID=A0A7W9HDC0_9ACTN|nr:ABC transporter permease subunit [Streptomyces caelestis]MBB5800177.1 ABC-type transport system involved in multi-copper enzyme maturation permease subunit [Streptomyces caelestis]GGW85895.1 transporter [Streptomyces caelestis]